MNYHLFIDGVLDCTALLFLDGVALLLLDGIANLRTKKMRRRGTRIRTRIVPARSLCCTLARTQCCTPKRVIFSNCLWKESSEGGTQFFFDEEKREWTCSFTVEHCSSYFSMYCVSHFCS